MNVPNVKMLDTILSDDSSIEIWFWSRWLVSNRSLWKPRHSNYKNLKRNFAGNVLLTATACDILPNVLQKVTNAILYQPGVNLKEVKSS